MEIRLGTPNDYPLLMEQVVQSFREKNPSHPRFEPMFPDAIGNDEERMARWRLAFIDGKLAAGIEIIPQSLRIGDSTIMNGGIGNVHCFPAFRNHGCMSALLERCINDMNNAGYPISLLGGDRARYGHYGWEYAGAYRQLNLSSGIVRHEDMDKPLCASDFKSYEGDPDDAQKMLNAYNCKKSGKERLTLQDFMDVMNRPWLVTYIDETTPGEFGYMSLRSGNSIAEYAGDTKAIERILRFVLKSTGTTVWLPPTEFSGDNEKMFFKYASGFSAPTVSMIRVNSISGVATAYQSLLNKRLAGWKGQFTLAVNDGECVTFSAQNGLTFAPSDNAPDLTVSRRELAHLLFGPFMPDAAANVIDNDFIRRAFPLPLFWQPLDHI